MQRERNNNSFIVGFLLLPESNISLLEDISSMGLSLKPGDRASYEEATEKGMEKIEGILFEVVGRRESFEKLGKYLEEKGIAGIHF